MNCVSLEELEKQIPTCTSCPLHETATQKVIRKGSENPKILFIGEAPGKNEDETGVPFCGRAGKVLDQIIDYMRLDEQEWAVINTIKCRPPNNRNPNKKELQACRSFLENQIELLDPKVIILLGNTAETAFVGKGTLGWGECREIDGSKVLKLYHPAALIYTRSRIPEQHQFIDANRKLWE
ncbi:DNA polymerase [Methanohalophilus levihalophilus]|uniref:uracil-DNA glycosylase n=1 Tax=Methanohalophilus levihalophilus TaxID=1431282 RepID=UPI001AE2B8DF|nr:uracil-DNA glycosylase [Methanohalophilus levihalophilus]MBP2031073.1 DNA polymerase [Methanohalophilus levihalophilus]